MSRSGLSYLEKTSQDVFGNTIDIPTALDRRTVQRFHCNGAVSAGDFVCLDLAQADSARAITVVVAGIIALGNALTVGVALEDGTAGTQIDVCTRGYVENAAVATGTAAGTPIVTAVGVPGRARAYVAADIAPASGVVLTLAAGNVADVYLFGIASDS
jgi:hypothetical protein